MSAKHVRTAADLVRFGCSLKAECSACGAAHTMTGVEVAKVHGNASLIALLGCPPDSLRGTILRPRLKCRRCRLKVARLTVLSPV